MAIDIQVIFTGLALFCLNEGTYCKNALDTVYLVNGTEDAKVCGTFLDGGHKPLLAFDARHLRPGVNYPHRVVPGPGGTRFVVSNIAQIELCICTEDTGSAGCPRILPGEPGAVPIDSTVLSNQEDPSFWRRDEYSFDWVPNLSKLHALARDRHLCPEVESDLPNKLVISRVRLDKGKVLTSSDWHDSWGGWMFQRWRRFIEEDYLIWDVEPGNDVTGGTHFPKAMPGKATWLIPDVPEDRIVLIQDCHPGRPQRTLFRLNSRGEDLSLHITNGPNSYHALAAGTEMDHFRWYYRLVDWKDDDGECPARNRDSNACLADLPRPMIPDSQLGLITGQGLLQGEQTTPTLEQLSEDIEGAITQTIKCPPANSG